MWYDFISNELEEFDSMKKEKSKRSGGKRAALIVLCTVLGIILTVLLAGTIYASRLMGSINRVGNEETLSQEQLDQLLAQEGEENVDGNIPTVNQGDIDWGSDVEKVEVGENIVNILLIGQDARGNERARSDSMILCTFNKDTNTITMTSFLRDLYVKIPGYYNNRINAAYPAGGMSLLNETLEYNFGVEVDGNLEVNFAHFAEVIDVLGGVDIELTGAEANYINNDVVGSRLTEGMHHLNGQQALCYSRIRKVGGNGDFGRTERQRKVLNSLIEEFRSADLNTMLNLLEEILPMITTDLSNAEIISLATELFPMLIDCTIVSQRIPEDGAYNMTMIDGMSVLLADMDAARALLKDTLTD